MKTFEIEKSTMVSTQDILPEKGKNVWTKSLCGFCVAYYDYDNIWKDSNTHKSLIGFYKPTEWKSMPGVILN